MRNIISKREMRNSLHKRMKRHWPYAEGDDAKVINLGHQKRLTHEEWRTMLNHFVPAGYKCQHVNEMAILLAGLPQWSTNQDEMAIRFSMVYSGLMKDVYGVGSEVKPEELPDGSTVYPSRASCAYKDAVNKISDAACIAFHYTEGTDMIVSELLQIERRRSSV